jgi:hypothetical protein
MNHPVQIIEELVAKSGRLTFLPGEGIVEFLPRDGEETERHLRRYRAVTSA